MSILLLSQYQRKLMFTESNNTGPETAMRAHLLTHFFNSQRSMLDKSSPNEVFSLFLQFNPH